MRDVMWNGELEGKIRLDTISNRKGLYGLGPESFLKGEITIKDGHFYISRVLSDTSMMVEETTETSAPFFVYSNVSHWKTMDLPDTVRTIKNLEMYLGNLSAGIKEPFTFTITALAAHAIIHIQNLPVGSTVRSPEEAHQSQINYILSGREVEIVGFYSTTHKGIFTHHDSNLHMHLITSDGKMMGHLDEIDFEGGVLKLGF